MPVIRAAARWLTTHPYAISVVILAAGVILAIAGLRIEIDRREDADARSRVEQHVAVTLIECRADNRSRELLRRIGVELNVANSEALITVAGGDADPADVEAFRTFTRQNAENIVGALTNRNCTAEAEAAEEQARAIEEGT